MRVGVDVGGTKIEAVLVNNGQILNSYRLPTQARKGKKQVLSNIKIAIDNVLTDKVKSIGIGLPGIIRNDVLVNCKNIPCLKGLNVAKSLNYNIPIYQDNDANCFALAEYLFGKYKGKNLVGLIIGTGIGSGIIIDGKLLRGANGSGGEVGKMIIHDGKTFEDLCSGKSIQKRYHAKMMVADIFKQTDAKSKKFISETMNYMSSGIASIANSIDPEVIVVGGGVSNTPFYADLNKLVQKKLINGIKVPVKKHSISDDAGTIGAAYLYKIR